MAIVNPHELCAIQGKTKTIHICFISSGMALCWRRPDKNIVSDINIQADITALKNDKRLCKSCKKELENWGL